MYAGNLLKYDKKIIIPTGEILLKLKKEHSIDELTRTLDFAEKINTYYENEYGTIIIRLKSDFDYFDVANSIYESKMVEWCHPNFYINLTANTNDQYYNDQYYLKNSGQFGGTSGIDININDAWALTSGSTNLKVAVLDFGVENHNDFNGRVLSGYTPQNPTGYGVPNGNNHGMACAGIIAATKDNTIGIAGICSNCKIVPINLGYDENTVTSQNLADGIDWARIQGQADILSNSWSTDTYAEFDNIRTAITNARTLGRNGKGCPVVFSSGNQTSLLGGVVKYPGRVDGVITVGAIQNNGQQWIYSGVGPSMDLVAPSGGYCCTLGNVRTTGLSNSYITDFGGTSAACPQVSGVAALMLSVNPNLTETQVRTILQQTAVDMGAIGFDNTFGYGRLNACAAVAKAMELAGGSPVTINGANGICTTSQTYTATNVPVGYTVSWDVIPAGIVNKSINGNSITLTKIGNLNSEIILKATLAICNSTLIKTKKINVGVPVFNFSNLTLDGQPWASFIESDEDGSNCIAACYSPGNPISRIVTFSSSNASTSTWIKVWSVPANYNFWNAADGYLTCFFKANNQSVVIKNTITNACGSDDLFFCFKSTFPCGNLRTNIPATQKLIIFPNPTNGNSTINLKLENEQKEQISFNNELIEIIDSKDKSVYTMKANSTANTSLTLPNLSNGIYYIKVHNSSTPLLQKIIVNNSSR